MSRHLISSTARAQRGVAIITVMLMITLAVIAVTAMMTEQRLEIYRAGNRLVGIQAKEMAVIGERVALQFLHVDRREAQRNNSDSLKDEWALSIPPTPTDAGGTVAGCVVDMQGRFNLNSLVDDDGKLDADQRDYLKRLFDVLDIDPIKISAIVDWVDKDVNLVDADGAEDDYYSQRTPPFLAANRRFADVTELKLVKGFDDESGTEDYETLLPHISVLPDATPVNINTATPALIEALIDFVDSGKAESLSRWDDDDWDVYPECRESPLDDNLAALTGSTDKDAFDEVDAFVTDINDGRKDDETKFVNTDLISIDSRYFEVRVDVVLGQLQLPTFTLMQRNDDGIITVLKRASGNNLFQIEGASGN
ncbi:MAG: type II secretion system minor pseudopilin GspK [Pseudomonadota bacterium]